MTTNKLIAECCDRVGEMYASPETAEFSVKLTNERAAEALANMQRGFLTPIDREALRMAEAALRAQGDPVDEIERLRQEQSASVMPMIGPLLDAWECCSQTCREELPELDTQLRKINRAMEGADIPPIPHHQGEEHGG
jgi:septation ring formation regulator EzrA